MLHVSCAADAAYVPHSAAMLHSVLAHTGGEDLHVHYLHGPAVPAAELDRLRGMVETGGGAITCWEIADERVAGLPEMEEITVPMWFRLFLPELLPEVDRVLYLDADTIAVDALAPLWKTNLDGSYVGAVTNVFQEDHMHHAWQLGIEPTEYFNSGVLLMNLDLMRADGAAEKLLDHARAHAETLVWPDQDTLNAVLGRRRAPLHPRWNAMNSVLTFEHAGYAFPPEVLAEAREHPAIRHFEGPSGNKPWHAKSWSPGVEVYLEHRRATPWPDVATPPRRGLRRLRP